MSRNESVSSTSFGRNHPKSISCKHRLRICFGFFGKGLLIMALIFSRSAFIPLVVEFAFLHFEDAFIEFTAAVQKMKEGLCKGLQQQTYLFLISLVDNSKLDDVYLSLTEVVLLKVGIDVQQLSLKDGGETEFVNDGIKLSKLEINSGFINGLPKKWLSFFQRLKNTNYVKDSEPASLFGKLKNEENLIDSIYETEKNKSLVSVTPLSIAFISTLYCLGKEGAEIVEMGDEDVPFDEYGTTRLEIERSMMIREKLI
ncbi:hypothetical protein Tco_1163720 [Tanacetum coccineum]